MFFLVFFNNVHMQYIMNETPSLSGSMRLIIGEALVYYRDECALPVRYVVLEMGFSVVY